MYLFLSLSHRRGSLARVGGRLCDLHETARAWKFTWDSDDSFFSSRTSMVRRVPLRVYDYCGCVIK